MRSWRSQIADEVRACSMMKPKSSNDKLSGEPMVRISLTLKEIQELETSFSQANEPPYPEGVDWKQTKRIQDKLTDARLRAEKFN